MGSPADIAAYDAWRKKNKKQYATERAAAEAYHATLEDAPEKDKFLKKVQEHFYPTNHTVTMLQSNSLKKKKVR